LLSKGKLFDMFNVIPLMPQGAPDDFTVGPELTINPDDFDLP
jgi:hypothetical protein